MELLIVNGVNTHSGGSVAESMKIWRSDLDRNSINYSILETFPLWKIRNFIIQKLLSGIYFLPGSVFRLLPLVFFEFFYKVSPFTIFQFLIFRIRTSPQFIIFSHHAIFYLAFFHWGSNKIALVHDLLFRRSRSKGSSRFIEKFTFRMELFFYRRFQAVFVQSYQEWRILRAFLGSKVFLITCCDLSVVPAFRELEESIAVIGDWRRPENRKGVYRFFSTIQDDARPTKGATPNLRFYGLASEGFVSNLADRFPAFSSIVSCAGTFREMIDIPELIFFVPVYEGAGIKRKTLEAICMDRFVIGTAGAFSGLPPWAIKNVTAKVSTVKDLFGHFDRPGIDAFSSTRCYLATQFLPITKALSFAAQRGGHCDRNDEPHL